MERLTERSKAGTAFFDDNGALIRGAGGAFHQKKDIMASFIHQRFVALDKAIDRLAAYEDAMPLERAQELAQAEKDGRLVVIPEKDGTKKYEIIRNESGWYDLVEMYFKKPYVGPTCFILASYKTRIDADEERKRRINGGSTD